MAFNIGDSVVRRNLLIPKSQADKGKIIDKMYSEAECRFLYRIRLDGENFTRDAFYTEEDFAIDDGKSKELLYPFFGRGGQFSCRYV